MSKQANKVSHTPGPWKVRPHQDRPHKLYVVDSKENIQCEMFNTVRAPSANARLIAAAPEMLEALKWAASLLNNADALTSYEHRREAEVRVNDAIAKAEGKEQ